VHRAAPGVRRPTPPRLSRAALGAVTHDHRIGAVAHFQLPMMMDVDQAAKAMRDAEIQDFIEGFNQPTYRGIPAWVVRR